MTHGAGAGNRRRLPLWVLLPAALQLPGGRWWDGAGGQLDLVGAAGQDPRGRV
jgi:hypothetical protein